MGLSVKGRLGRMIGEGVWIIQESCREELVGIGIRGGDSGFGSWVHTKKGLFDKIGTGVRGE